MSELPPDPDNPEVVHEETDVNVGVIIRWGIGLAATVFVSLAFLFWLQGLYTRQAERGQVPQYPMAADRRGELPPEPRLQNDPQEDLRVLRAKQQSLLEGYGWVNKEAGIARIPIDEAMKLVVARGLPTRDGAK
jgi:hypothetical protein